MAKVSPKLIGNRQIKEDKMAAFTAFAICVALAGILGDFQTGN